MSLSDCITKAGKALSGKDRQAIENLVAEGLSETEAVDQYLATVDQELEAVAGQVEEAGGAVERSESPQAAQALTSEGLKQLSLEIKDKYGLDALAMSIRKDGAIELANIAVPEANRSSGAGSSAMADIVALADRYGRKIHLNPARPDDQKGTTSQKRLVEFYKRFGFIENKGRNRDFEFMGGMVRQPVTSFNQKDQRALPRGTIQLLPDGERIIALGKESNPSTFLHETAHPLSRAGKTVRRRVWHYRRPAGHIRLAGC